MFEIVLYQPEIPPNTGNIIRLCANTGACLHLVRPLGFRLDDRLLARAGLDYGEYARMAVHHSWDECLGSLGGARLFAVTTRGDTPYHAAAFHPGDAFVFGPETRGLPPSLLAGMTPERRLRLPMQAGSRSLNLSNAVAVVVYEAWRQQGFAGGE